MEKVSVCFWFEEKVSQDPLCTELFVIPREGEYIRLQNEDFDDDWFLVVKVQHELELKRVDDRSNHYQVDKPHVNIELKKLPGQLWILSR